MPISSDRIAQLRKKHAPAPVTMEVMRLGTGTHAEKVQRVENYLFRKRVDLLEALLAEALGLDLS